jgi:hypothetical protein
MGSGDAYELWRRVIRKAGLSRTSEWAARLKASDAQQLTLNQRVQGSNPCTPTNKIRNLAQFSPASASQKCRLGSVWEALADRR